MSVTGKFRIKKGKVNLRNRKTNFVVPDVTAIRFKGKLNFKANFRKKKRPQGTFRADVTVNAEGLGRCTFGQLGWKARRGARVDASVPVS